MQTFPFGPRKGPLTFGARLARHFSVVAVPLDEPVSVRATPDTSNISTGVERGATVVRRHYAAAVASGLLVEPSEDMSRGPTTHVSTPTEVPALAKGYVPAVVRPR